MSRPNPSSRPDVYRRITQIILDQLEAGVRPWTRPWAGGAAAGRPLRHDGTPYRGVNVLLLWSQAAERGYDSPTWMTFRQALALGGAVRKGERGAPVVYAHVPETPGAEPDAEAEPEGPTRRRAFLKAYTVFNVAQIEGLPERYAPLPPASVNPDARVAEADAWVERVGATVRHGGSQAFYAPGPDIVQMPDFDRFVDAHGYYATLVHELVHWTRHPSRLDRDLGARRFGDAGYAREELVAEIGAAFLCADLGLALEPREDHAAYIADWIEVLKDDRRFIVSAAAHAQRAADHLHASAAAP